MITPLVENNTFSGYQAGRNELIAIFHLQFVDDTLILERKIGIMLE